MHVNATRFMPTKKTLRYEPATYPRARYRNEQRQLIARNESNVWTSLLRVQVVIHITRTGEREGLRLEFNYSASVKGHQEKQL